MATIDPAADSGGWRYRTAMRLGHYSARISMVSYAIMAVSFSLAAFLQDGPVPAIFIMAPGITALAFSMVADQCDRHVHRQSLCPLDVDRSPLSNPDLDAEVQRRANVFRAYHSPGRRLFVSVTGFALVVCGVFVGHWAHDNGVPLAALIAVVPYTAMMGVQAWNVWIDDVHRRLLPWCTYCWWGHGGGWDDPEPEPDPTPPPLNEKDKIRAGGPPVRLVW